MAVTRYIVSKDADGWLVWDGFNDVSASYIYDNKPDAQAEAYRMNQEAQQEERQSEAVEAISMSFADAQSEIATLQRQIGNLKATAAEQVRAYKADLSMMNPEDGPLVYEATVRCLTRWLKIQNDITTIGF